MFKRITCKTHNNTDDVYLVNMVQIKCVAINMLDIEVQNCFDIDLRFGGGCSVNCKGVIVGGYEAIDRFINGEDTTLFIDSTKL